MNLDFKGDSSLALRAPARDNKLIAFVKLQPLSLKSLKDTSTLYWLLAKLGVSKSLRYPLKIFNLHNEVLKLSRFPKSNARFF